jgi:hypothetical protein
MAVNDLITFRKGIASQWVSINPVLASGEPGYDLTNSVLKIGDGVSNWVALSGIGSTSVGGSSSYVGVRGVISTTGNLSSFAVSGGYPVGYLDLFQDGIKLVSDLDFSATDGSNVSLSNSVPSGTVLEYLTMASGVSSGGGSSSLPSNISGTLSVNGDSSYGSVVLLLHGNTFTDSSSYNRTVTSYGGIATTGTAKYGTSSYSLSSVGDYLGVPSSTAFSFGTGDFTLEAWIRPTSYPQDNAGAYVSTIFGRQQSGDHCFRFDLNGTSSSLTGLTFVGFPDNGDGSSLSANYSFSLNTWYHIAVSRVSGILYLFINGTLLNSGGTSFTTTIKDSSNEMRIGALNFDNTYKFQFFGLIADARITKGIGRYSSSFTSPTSEFPNNTPYSLSSVSLSVSGSSGSSSSSGLSWSSVPSSPTASGTAGSISYDGSSGFFYVASATNSWRRFRPDAWDVYRSSTSLMLPFDGTMTDYSPTPKTVTVNGNASALGAAKFGSYALSLGATNTNDWLEVSHATEFNFGAGDFTIELWYYPISRGSYACVFGAADYPLTLYHGTQVNSGNPSVAFGPSNSAWFSGASAMSLGSVTDNQWCHIAIVRQGDTFRAYKNGVQQATATTDSAGQALGDIPTLFFGKNGDFYNKCLIDDFRVTKGICRFPNGTTFTPPTVALPID